MNWQVGDTVTILPVAMGSTNLVTAPPPTFVATLTPTSGGAAQTLGAVVSVDVASPTQAQVRFAATDVATPGSYWLKIAATMPSGGVIAPPALPFTIVGSAVARPANWSSSYLKTSNGILTRAGQPVSLFGATMYPYWFDGGAFRFGSSWARAGFAAAYIPVIIGYLQQFGMNFIRITDFLAEGNGALYNDATVWGNIDSAIAQFKAANIMVEIDFSEFRNYIINHLSISDPYAPSVVTTNWQPMLSFVLNRYLTEPGVVLYSIAGEVPQIGATNSAANSAEYTSFFTSVSAYIKGIDTNHLLCTGGFTHIDQDSYQIPWQTITALANIDIGAVHAYADRDRFIAMPAMQAYVASLNPVKPWLLEEFGFQQNMGDQQRAYAIQHEYDLARNCGAAGAVIWNLANHVTGGTEYDVDPVNYPFVSTMIKQMVTSA